MFVDKAWASGVQVQVLLQRVKEASVVVEGRVVGSIGQGWLALVGVAREDEAPQVDALSRKILSLRAFSDAEGKMNHSLLDIGGEVLAVSQFTLYADTRKGNRPGFSKAAAPELARSLYEMLVMRLKEKVAVATGIFGADMEVRMVGDGPVTLTIHA